MLESDIAALQISKKLLGIGTRSGVGGAGAGRSGWRRLFNSVINKMACALVSKVAITLCSRLPVHCWNHLSQRLPGFLGIELLGVCVNASNLVHSRDSTAHPASTAGKLIVRSEDGPV